MAASDKYRRINIGFKPDGVDPDQDRAFEILKALDKKGSKAWFIARTILEYINAHQGVVGGERLGGILVISSDSRDKPPNRQAKDLTTDAVKIEHMANTIPEDIVGFEVPIDQKLKPMDDKKAEQINSLLDMFSNT